ncbi:hypothetical protein CCACVL1_13401 [Corchorus capsularis]|uniref:Uncharacterized protein n=1 Tax=Corchorus capsularis TaxID=210143 RepID=A0A1R3IB66_COCAP|nr:hypothetical protein CCACVL1_13401 [Corchorus capsularis]
MAEMIELGLWDTMCCFNLVQSLPVAFIMGRNAKTLINLLLLLVYIELFIGRVKGLDHIHSANSTNSATNEGMIKVQTRKLMLEVDIQRDYSPIPNPKHEPGPPRGKTAAFAAGGGS